MSPAGKSSLALGTPKQEQRPSGTEPPCLDSRLELEELWDDMETQVLRFSTTLAQQTLCNSNVCNYGP